MRGDGVVGLIVAIVFGCVGLGASALAAVVPVVVIVMVLRHLKRSGATVGILAPAPTSTARPWTEPARGGFVKRCVCRFCATPKATPSRAAYVSCDACGELIDFDFQAAMSDKRSKMPGPAYEAILRRLAPQLEQARASGEAPSYHHVQEQIFEAYVTACPAAVSPRIGDPAYRARFVQWSAASTTATDLDPGCQATFAAQQAAVGQLTWDRSDPFRPKARPDTFWPMIDAVLAHQARSAEVIERAGLLEHHPDRPTPEILRKIGLSLLVQGWMPVLDKATADALLDRTGLRDDYVHVDPPDLERGTCPHCSAALEVVAGARRVVCSGCGHMAGVHGGSLSCHGCAAPIEVPDGTTSFGCTSCGTELRRMVWA